MNAVLLGRKRRIAFDGSSLSEGLLFANSPLYGPTLGVANGSRKSGIDDLAYSGAIGGQSFALSGSRWGGILGLAGTSGSTVDTWGVSTTSINTKLANSNAATAVAILRTDTTALWGDVSGVALKNGGDGEHYPYSDGKIYSGPFCTARWVNAYTPTSPLSVPHMIAATSKVSGGAGRQQFYFNNELAATASRTDTPSIGTSLRIGGNGWWYFLGLWNRELSPEELTRLYSGEWKTYQSQRRIFSFPSAGGGGATDIAGALESISLSTFGATVGSARAIAGALESLSLTPYTATVGSARAITAAVESISLGTYAATVSRDTALAGGLESIALTTNPATVQLGAAIAAALEAIVLATNPAAVALDAAIAAQLEAITITGLGATVSTSSDVNIGAALESITLSVPQALVSSDRAISGGLESIQITANGATVTLGALIGAALENIALTSYGAGITLNVTLPGALEQINLTTLAAQIGLGSNVSALVEAITLTEFGATLTMTGAITAALESIGLTTFVASVTGGESALTTPGLEFTIPVGRMHYSIPIGRIHFTIPRD